MKNETWSSSDIFLFMWLARLLEKRAILNIWENRVIIPKIKLKTQNIELKAKKSSILLITVKSNTTNDKSKAANNNPEKSEKPA